MGNHTSSANGTAVAVAVVAVKHQSTVVSDVGCYGATAVAITYFKLSTQIDRDAANSSVGPSENQRATDEGSRTAVAVVTRQCNGATTVACLQGTCATDVTAVGINVRTAEHQNSVVDDIGCN